MTAYDPEQPENLASLLGAYVSVYWNEYVDYWDISEQIHNTELTPEQRAVHRRLDQIGRAIRETLNSLTPDPESEAAVAEFLRTIGLPDPPKLDTALALRALHTWPLVRDCVSISLAGEAADVLLPEAERRAAELVGLLTTSRLSDRALAYLRRATRLHLWGFDAECVIMCRSVLEAALTTRLIEVEAQLDSPPPPLEILIAIAGQQGLIPGYERASNRRGWRAKRTSPLADAESLRRVGNHLLHDIPLLQAHEPQVGDSLSALKLLLGLLNLLFPKPG